MLRYRALLLDADDTVFDFEQAEALAYRDTMAPLGYGRDADAAQYHAINAMCWQALERGETTQDRLRVERFERLLAELGVRADAAEVAREYTRNLGMQGMLLPGALEAVRAVAEQMPIAVVTNGIAQVQRSRMSCSAIRPYISHLIISQEVGAAKPDPRMVYAALEQLGGLKREDVLMVGDSVSSDMLAANRAGVDFCWYNPQGKTQPLGMRVKCQIADIRNLPRVALEQIKES